jgi:hypothetical protein
MRDRTLRFSPEIPECRYFLFLALPDSPEGIKLFNKILSARAVRIYDSVSIAKESPNVSVRIFIFPISGKSSCFLGRLA